MKTPPTTPNVAIYVRVSTLDQAREGYSLAAQRETLVHWCENNGYTYKVYEDAGISGKDIKHRPAMSQMLDDAKDGRYCLVLVWALSRFTRSVKDLYNTYDYLQGCGCNIKSHTEAFDTSTPMGRGVMGISAVVAQIERELDSERTQFAMLERATQGKRTCNEVLGYDKDGKDSLKINEVEAERVRYIYDKYLEHRSLSAVADLCKLKGYCGKRGRVFKPWQIKVILSRPIYAGYNSFHGEVYKGHHEPIIPIAMWREVQELIGIKSKI